MEVPVARDQNQKEKQVEEKLKLREQNIALSKARPDEDFFRTLDSSIRKVNAFTKKLKTLSHSQRANLCTEARSLNLTRYISEVATGIAEAPIKTADIPCAVEICSLLYQRYNDFGTHLYQAITRPFFEGEAPTPHSAQQAQGPLLPVCPAASVILRRRTAISLLAELHLVGVLEDTAHILDVARRLAQDITRGAPPAMLLALFTFVSLTRNYGAVLAGLHTNDASLAPLASLVPADKQRVFLSLAELVLETAARALTAAHKELHAFEQERARSAAARGEVYVDGTTAHEDQRKAYGKLANYVQTLAEVMGHELPPLDTAEPASAAAPLAAESMPTDAPPAAEGDAVFDDDETRRLYEDLPDVASQVPAICLDPHRQARTADPAHSGDKARPDVDSMQTILERLPKCVNRDLIDRLAVDFCYINTKANRKRLVTELFNVPRTKLELLPYYARLVAALDPIFHDVPQALIQMLIDEFNLAMKEKHPVKIESKIRNITFIGELVKFRVCRPEIAFQCLDLCFQSFSDHAHAIDVACTLLETCGRFLFRTPATHMEAEHRLEVLQRLRMAKSYPPQLDVMMENAYYHCKPVAQSAIPRKVRPPLVEYLRKLIYRDLSKSSIEKVMCQILKLPATREATGHLVGTLVAVHRCKYNRIHYIAQLIAALHKCRVSAIERAVIMAVDGVLEAVRAGMERSTGDEHVIHTGPLPFRPTHQQRNQLQRRQAQVKLIGELYRYRMITKQALFETLAQLLTRGHLGEADAFQYPDPPTDYTRIRLVSTLLRTCGRIFEKGLPRLRIDLFLAQLKLYVLSKSAPLPPDVEFDLRDMIEQVRPALMDTFHCKTPEEAVENFRRAAEALEASERKRSRDKAAQQRDLAMASLMTAPLSAPPSSAAHAESDSDSEDSEESEETDEEADEEAIEPQAAEDATTIERPPSPESQAEDDIFRREYERLCDSTPHVLAAQQVHRRLDVAIPMRARNIPTPDSAEGHVAVTVLLKRGNKPTVRHLNVPEECSLGARHVQGPNESEQADLDANKKFILSLERRQEERQLDDGLDDFDPNYTGSSLQQEYLVQYDQQQTQYYQSIRRPRPTGRIATSSGSGLPQALHALRGVPVRNGPSLPQRPKPTAGQGRGAPPRIAAAPHPIGGIQIKTHVRHR